MDNITYFNAKTRKECEYVVENCDSDDEKNEDGLTWVDFACKTNNFTLFDAYKNFYEHMPIGTVCSALKYGSIDMVIYCLQYDQHDVEYDIACPEEDVVETNKSPSIYSFPIKYKRPEIIQFLFDNNFRCNGRYYINNKYVDSHLEYAINQINPDLEIIRIILNNVKNLAIIFGAYSKAIKIGCSMDIVNMFNQFDMIMEIKSLPLTYSAHQRYANNENGVLQIIYEKFLLEEEDFIAQVLINVFTTQNQQNIDMYLVNVISHFGIKKVVNNKYFLFGVFQHCSLKVIKKVCNFLYENDVYWWDNIDDYIGFAINNDIESFYTIWDFLNNFKFNIFTKIDNKYAIIDHAIKLSYTRKNPHIYKTVFNMMFKKDPIKCKKYIERSINMFNMKEKKNQYDIINYVGNFFIKKN